MQSEMDNFGKKVRKLRHQMGYSLQALSEKIGVTKPTLSLIENGNRIPSEDVVRKLAKFFGKDEEEWAFLVKAAPQIEKIRAKYPTQAPAYLRRTMKPPFGLTRTSFYNSEDADDSTPFLSVVAIRRYAQETLRLYAKKIGRTPEFPLDAEDIFYKLFGLETYYDEEGVLNRFGESLIGALYPEGHSFLGSDKRIVVNCTEGFENFTDDFTIAHEGGHYVFHHLKIGRKSFVIEPLQRPLYCRGEGHSRPEWQANRYAGELLMPIHRVQWILDGKQPGEIINLAVYGNSFRKFFEASQSMMEKRLVDLEYKLPDARYDWANYVKQQEQALEEVKAWRKATKNPDPPSLAHWSNLADEKKFGNRRNLS